MTQAKILELVDKLVAALNVAPSPFVAAFTATRGYCPVLELPTRDSLSVLCIHAAHETAIEDRTTYGDTWTVDTAIQKKWATFDDAEADTLTLLTEQIAERLRRRELLPGYTLVDGAVRALFIPEHATKFQQFSAVLSTTWRRFVDLDDS